MHSFVSTLTFWSSALVAPKYTRYKEKTVMDELRKNKTENKKHSSISCLFDEWCFALFSKQPWRNKHLSLFISDTIKQQ